MSAGHITLFNAIEDDLYALAKESTDEYWQAFTNAENNYVMTMPVGHYSEPTVRRSIDLTPADIDPKELEAIIASEGLNAGYAYVVEKALPVLLAQIPAALEGAERPQRSLSGTKILSTIFRYLRYRLVPRWDYLSQALKDLYIYLLFVTVSDVEPPRLIYDEDWYDEPPEEDVKAYERELDRFEIVREQIVDILVGLDTSGILSLIVEEDEPAFEISRDLDALIKGYLPGRSHYTVVDREGILKLL